MVADFCHVVSSFCRGLKGDNTKERNNHKNISSRFVALFLCFFRYFFSLLKFEGRRHEVTKIKHIKTVRQNENLNFCRYFVFSFCRPFNTSKLNELSYLYSPKLMVADLIRFCASSWR
jgi:hypothetical protein